LRDKRATRCARCAKGDLQERRRQRRDEIENKILAMRMEGILNVHIATELRISTLAVNAHLTRMKKRGIEIPETTYDPRTWNERYYRIKQARAQRRWPSPKPVAPAVDYLSVSFYG
jgi:hypothetical protein